MNTPENITSLLPGQVFVFGSNVKGHHAGGAAKVAVERFGAVWGRGEGLQGNCYAIPTMEGIDSLRMAVSRFLYFAATNPSLEFLVTKIGTGIAGYTVDEIAPLFADAAPNVIVPAEFEVSRV